MNKEIEFILFGFTLAFGLIDGYHQDVIPERSERLDFIQKGF
jgi:hypothetical protein